MKTQMRLLIALNFALVLAVIGLLVVAMPNSAEASRNGLVVTKDKIEFHSTFPCRDNAPFVVRPSKRSINLKVPYQGMAGETINYVKSIKQTYKRGNSGWYDLPPVSEPGSL